LPLETVNKSKRPQSLSLVFSCRAGSRSPDPRRYGVRSRSCGAASLSAKRCRSFSAFTESDRRRLLFCHCIRGALRPSSKTSGFLEFHYDSAPSSRGFLLTSALVAILSWVEIKPASKGRNDPASGARIRPHEKRGIFLSNKPDINELMRACLEEK
jgi:hypothetical protein